MAELFALKRQRRLTSSEERVVVVIVVVVVVVELLVALSLRRRFKISRREKEVVLGEKEARDAKL